MNESMNPERVKLNYRIGNAIQWRLAVLRAALRDRIYNTLGSWGSRAFVQLRWLWPLRKPYQRRQLLLRPPGVGIGDNLMCTPIFREIKRRNPDCHITFLTRYPELFQDNPNIDQLTANATPQKTAKAIRLGYDHMAPRFVADQLLAKGLDVYRQAAKGRLFYGYVHPNPPPRPLMSIMAECVGLEFYDNQVECAVPMVTPEFRTIVSQIARPIIVIQPHASDWTPNKTWPASYWRKLVETLVADYNVVEAGTRAEIGADFQHPRFHSLAGYTSISEFIHLVSEADLFVGPVSGGMHLANAFHVPAIILYGGWESPAGHRYPNVIPLYSPIECAPCWLTTPCPYQTKCLTMISPAQVMATVRQALSNDTGSKPTTERTNESLVG